MKENKSFKKRCIGVLAGKKVMAVVLSAVLCLSVSGTVWADLRTAIQLSGPGSYTIPDDLRDDQQHNLDKMSIYLHDGVSCIIKTNVLSITGTERNKNIIIKSGGVVEESVYGGSESPTRTTISNNSVTIEGGTVTGSVYGGYSNNANNNNAISNNTVTLNGGSVQSNVYGGFSANGAVSNNTVILKGGTVEGSVNGGASNGTISNNTLHIAGKSLSVGGVMGFQNLKFTIPNDMTTSDTLLIIKGEVNFQGMSIDTKNIKPGEMTCFKTGDRITLIHSDDGISNVTYTGSSCTGPNGEVKCHFTNDQNNLYLVIDDKGETKKDTPHYDDSSDDEPVNRYTLKETAQTAPVTYTPGGNLTTTITTTNGGEDPFDLFRNAQLNGVTLIRGRHYTIRRGSLIISLLPEALNDLPEGTNYLTVFFEDGDITIPFNLAELPEGNTKGAPKTGEI